MCVTIKISAFAVPTLPRIDLPALTRVLRPWLAPILVATAEAAGLGPFAPVLVGLGAKVVLAGSPA